MDGEAIVRLELGAFAQLVGNVLGVASAVLLFDLVDRTSKRPLHAHRMVNRRLRAELFLILDRSWQHGGNTVTTLYSDSPELR